MHKIKNLKKQRVNCTLSLQLSPERRITFSWSFFVFTLTVFSIKVANQTRNDMFSIAHSIFHPLHLRLYGGEDLQLRKTALYPLLRAVHTQCLLVPLCGIRKETNFLPTTVKRSELEGREKNNWVVSSTPKLSATNAQKCAKKKRLRQMKKFKILSIYVGVPVNFPQGLPSGRLEPVWSDLHPCSFLTRPVLMSCAPSCPA